MKSIRAVISGRVQGVCFRAYTQEKAFELGVRGYVKNLPDGNVELVAVGEDALVDALMHWASEGPPGARIDHVKVDLLETRQKFDRFTVAY